MDTKTNSKKWLWLVGSARHDYTTSTWYVQGMKEKESFWSESYYYEDNLNVASGYYTPLRRTHWSVAIVVKK